MYELGEFVCPTLEEVINKYFEIRTVSPRTRYDYRSVLSRRLADWMPLPFNQITGEMVMDRFREIKTQPSEYKEGKIGAPVEANRTMQILRCVLNFGKAYYRVQLPYQQNPVDYLNQCSAWSKEQSRLERFLSADQLPIWLKEVLHLKSRVSSDLFLVLLLTGLRLHEALELKWEDVQWNSKILRVGFDPERKLKNNHPFQIPMCQQLYVILRHRHAEARQGCDWIFEGVTTTGRPSGFPLVTPQKAVKVVARRSGIDWSPHDLRRTFVNLLTHPEVGGEELEIKALINHVDGVTRKHYLTTNTERLRPVMDRLGAFIGKQLPTATVQPLIVTANFEDVDDVDEVED